ncbi:MAG: MBL fold metallo-hydrolase [Myxococcota bacterium]
MHKHNPKTVQVPQRLERNHPFRQWKRWKIPGTDFTLIGYSRSNDFTFFYIPELKCCLDAGLCEGRKPDYVFLTHTHNDHAADIEFLASKDTGAQLYAPEQSVDYIKAFIRSKRELNHVAAFDPQRSPPVLLQGVRDGDNVAFGKKGQYNVRVVKCKHKIPCVGYCFSEIKMRLKPEFQKLKEEMKEQGKAREFGKLMAEKRRENIEVQERYEQPLFVFMGDTHVRVFEENPWLLDYPVIITECTYLNDQERERAESNGHTLWSQLRPFIESNPQTIFVLTHFSLRHSDREVIAFFEALTSKEPSVDLSNVVLWAQSESYLPEQHQRR